MGNALSVYQDFITNNRKGNVLVLILFVKLMTLQMEIVSPAIRAIL